jgi:hypothetical protein
LVTLQGEDLCANFIRDQAPRWMTQLWSWSRLEVALYSHDCKSP